jgi:hypothetical protein
MSATNISHSPIFRLMVAASGGLPVTPWRSEVSSIASRWAAVVGSSTSSGWRNCLMAASNASRTK